MGIFWSQLPGTSLIWELTELVWVYKKAQEHGLEQGATGRILSQSKKLTNLPRDV